MWTFARRSFTYLRTHGLTQTIRYAGHRISERRNERRLRIQTGGRVLLWDLGINNGLCKHYVPTEYRVLKDVLNTIRIRKNKDVFLDYGSGKGRVVVVAGTRPFQSVIGIEIAPELIAVAEDNVRRAHKRLQCNDIRFVATDAAAYRVPRDVTVVFFYNSFEGEILTRVFANIRRSLRDNPRPFTLICNNPPDALATETGPGGWLVERREFFDHDRRHRTVLYANTGWRS